MSALEEINFSREYDRTRTMMILDRLETVRSEMLVLEHLALQDTRWIIVRGIERMRDEADWLVGRIKKANDK